MENYKKHIFGLKDIVIFSLFSLLVGLIMGFCFAPVKKGMNIGCNNGNNYNVPEKDKEEEFKDDLAMEMNELR